MPFGEEQHLYSGSALTVEKAEEDILLSAQHYVEVHPDSPLSQ